MGADKLGIHSGGGKKKLVEEVRVLRSRLAKLESVKVKSSPNTEDITYTANISDENPNPVLRISRDWIILFANDASQPVLDAWGCKTGQRMPQLCTEWVGEAFNSGEISTFEFASEKGLVFLLTLIPAVNAGYVNIYGVDITERKHVKEKLIDYQNRLKSLAWQLSLVEERERRRIAEGLHDDITQALISVKMRLAQLHEDAESGRLAEDINKLKEYVGELIHKTRLLAFDLSSPVLYEVGLEAAIRGWLTKEIKEKHNIRTEFEDDGLSKPLDENVQIQLFRSVRELLLNVIKHAHAQKVKVSVYKKENQIKIAVEDNGIGFESLESDSDFDWTSGFGLFSIRENLSQLGGFVEIVSRAGQSTVILAAPLKSGNINE